MANHDLLTPAPLPNASISIERKPDHGLDPALIQSAISLMPKAHLNNALENLAESAKTPSTEEAPPRAVIDATRPRRPLTPKEQADKDEVGKMREEFLRTQPTSSAETINAIDTTKKPDSLNDHPFFQNEGTMSKDKPITTNPTEQAPGGQTPEPAKDEPVKRPDTNANLLWNARKKTLTNKLIGAGIGIVLAVGIFLMFVSSVHRASRIPTAAIVPPKETAAASETTKVDSPPPTATANATSSQPVAQDTLTQDQLEIVNNARGTTGVVECWYAPKTMESPPTKPYVDCEAGQAVFRKDPSEMRHCYDVRKCKLVTP